MSKNNLSEEQQAPVNAVLSTLRKASDSTVQMAEYLKSQQLKLKPSADNSEQYDQQLYNELSSGVYQIEHCSSQDENPSEEQKPNNQRESVHEDLPEKSSPQSSTKLQAQTSQHIQPQNQETGGEVNSEQKGGEAESQRIQQREQPKQENNFEYPSLMEESAIDVKTNEGFGGNSTEPKKDHSKKKGHFQEIYNSEEEQEINSEEDNDVPKVEHEQAIVIFQREEEEMSESAKAEMQLLNQKVQEELKKQSIQDKARQETNTVKEESLIQLQREHPKPLLQTTFSPFVHSSRHEQIIMEQQRHHLKANNLNEPLTMTSIRIIGYEKQYFLKIQTQVYQIQYSSPTKSYVFCRKFSDFVVLNKMIKQQYPGYILYPFPENNLEFFKSLKLSVGNEVEKIIMIEQRLLELEHYLNFLLNHRELSSSQILEIFISESKDLFGKQFLVLEQAIDRAEQQYGSSKIRDNYNSIKSLVKSGINFFSSYVSSPPVHHHQHSTLILQIKRKAEHLLKTYEQLNLQLMKDIQICDNFLIKMQKLIQIYRYNKNVKPIQSSIDSVLIFCTKTASSKAYYEEFQNWLEDHLVREILYFNKSFKSVEEMIQYRTDLLERVAGMDVEEAKLAMSLIERAEHFDSRFLEDWKEFNDKFQQKYQEMEVEFNQKWDQHCKLMIKIWK